MTEHTAFAAPAAPSSSASSVSTNADRPDLPATPKEWSALLAPYRGSDTGRSVWQLASTMLLFLAFWYASYRALEVSWWLTLALAVPTAMMVVRLFMLQHDCGHGSFFRSNVVADAVGSVLGVITLVPYTYWRKTHAIHHASSGDLDGRDFGDIDTLTVKEYLALPKTKRLMYRLYRNPITMFIVGPAWQFVLKHRLPLDIPFSWKREWMSVHLTNVLLAGAVALMCWTVGWQAFLTVQIPVTLLAGAIGIYLFYVQHQYEDTYWRYRETWNYYKSALEGASHLVMPKFLQWCTANIGLHHIHHLASKIPNYKLQRCFDEIPALQQVTTLTLRQSVSTLRLTLWDEDEKKLVTFRELKRIRQRLAAEIEMGAMMATKPEAVPRNWR
jgi:omega-6 fatty acid desaturase (delta-12 desaturase)